MGEMTTLGDAIRHLASLDPDATIYAARPWSPASAAVVAIEPGPGGLPDLAASRGLGYFLEVAVARDFLDVWESALGLRPTESERCERLILYAIDDA